MHKELRNINHKVRTKVQLIHNAKTHVVLFNFLVVGYVMVHPANLHYPKLNTGWIERMRNIKATSDLVFEVENLHKCRSVHAKLMISYPIQQPTEPL